MNYNEWIKAYVERQPDQFVRGKCKEAVTEMLVAFPELRKAAGFAHVTWGRDEHWWCVAPDDSIVDPTRSQFQFGVVFEYEELDLNDPSSRALIPTGRCMDCGEDTYNDNTFCNERCENATRAYLGI